MGEINSPLGNRKFESTSMGHYTVDDASGENYSEPMRASGPQRMTYEEAMTLRQQKINEVTGGNGGNGGGDDGGGVSPARNSNTRASEGAKRRIEMLIGVGRQTKEVPINTDNGPVTFSIRTLKSKEMRDLMQLASEMAKQQSIDTPYAIRERTLSLALYAIDGIDVDLVLDTVDRPMRERLAARVMLLDEMNEYTLTHLYREHESMMEENAKLFGIKSTEDAKEVASQIKKSSQGA